MKKLLASILLLLPLLTFAADPIPPPAPGIGLLRTNGMVFVTWDAVLSPSISHYIVGWGTNSSLIPIVFSDTEGLTVSTNLNTGENYVFQINSGTNIMQKIDGLKGGDTYFIGVRAVSTGGEISDWSQEINYIPTDRLPPIRGVRTVRVPVYTLDILFSDVIGEWQNSNSVTLVVSTDKPYQFFTVRNRMELAESVMIE